MVHSFVAELSRVLLSGLFGLLDKFRFRGG